MYAKKILQLWFPMLFMHGHQVGYDKYPNIPKGILEAPAYSASHISIAFS